MGTDTDQVSVTRWAVDTFGPEAVAVAVRLASAGFAVAVVGGAVRDLVSGHSAKDVDVTTSARPETVSALLADVGTVFPLGERFGTVAVNVGGVDIEVTTWRVEQYDTESRNPTVAYGESLDEDLSRRDFTVNAMAAVFVGDAWELVDPHMGATDLADGVLRTPGEPDQIFKDDPLRIVRGWRLALTKGLDINAGTGEAMYQNRHRLGIVSRERVTSEMLRVLDDPRIHPIDAVQLAARYGIDEYVFGSLSDLRGLTRHPVPEAAMLTAAGKLAALARFSITERAGRAALEERAAFQSEMKFTTELARSVFERAHAANALEAVETVAEVRRVVRSNEDSVLDEAVILCGLNAPTAMLDAVRSEPGVRDALGVDGNDVIAAGVAPGAAIGAVLAQVEWARCSSERWTEETERQALSDAVDDVTGASTGR